MKHSFISLVLLAIVNYIVPNELSFSKNKKLSKMKGREEPAAKVVERPINLDIADAQVYFQGWVKYYHYNNDTHYKKPPSLFQNNQYFHQRIPKEKYNQRDTYGLFRIPNKAAFFVVLYNQTLAFFSNRDNQVDKLVDSLKVKHMRVVPEDDVLNGGIRDDGNFPFGYCIEIVADIPASYPVDGKATTTSPETWIVCTSKPEEKDIMLSTLIKLKVKHQRLENNGLKITTVDKSLLNKPKPAIGSMIANPTGTADEDRRTGLGDLKDGYWVLLQDWTSCSVKCGNGTSYQQWMCVPPKNGGKDCVGSAVRTRLCNSHPCPSINNLLTIITNNQKAEKKGDVKIAPKPIVKAGLFSNRPQRYSKCIIKENDAFIVAKVDGSTEPVRKPIRIMMNNMTITIYNDDKYEEMYNTFDIQKTKFTYRTEHCCFEIEDTSKKDMICGYNEYCGPSEKNEWVDGWSTDFNEFKTICKTELPVNNVLNNVLINDEIEDELKKKSSEIMMEAEVNAANQQSVVVKKEVLKQAKRQYQQKKKQAENLSFSVIGKEINLENMVKKEEETKEEIEQRMLEEQIKKEEYKQECLEKSFEEKELDDDFVETQKESLDEVNEVNQQAKKKIENSRNKLRKTIQRMKLKAKNKNQDLANKLKSIRTKMTKQIMLANKNGNIDTCRNGKENADFRETYCNNNYVDDWSRNSDCKGEEFCYICCETEFGAMFVTQRDSCYNMCDFKPKPVVPDLSPLLTGRNIRADINQDMSKLMPKENVDDNAGKWVWAPKETSDFNGANAAAAATK